MENKILSEIEHKVQTHVPPEINYALENTISYSQYSTYVSCPFKWYLSYAKNLDPHKPSIFTIFGTSIHETIQNYLDILYNKSPEEANSIDIIEYFNDRFRENYSIEYEKLGTHFSSPKEMGEFFQDGSNILQWFKTHRESHFSTRKIKLLGIEIPLLYKLNKFLYYKGYIDFVLHDENDDIVYIYDIKTSTRGWKDKEKKDNSKISQLILYKEFFSKQYGIDIDKIEVEYFIVKRKIYESSDYIIPRIQTFVPASGKIKRKKIMEEFGNFIKTCYNEEGKIIEKEYKKIVGKSSCTYCPFNNDKNLCDKK